MKYAGILLLAVAAVTTAALAALGPLPPTTQATLPPGAGCPATPGTGTSPWVVSATLPAAAGQNANGVCINCTGTGDMNNTATLQTNAAGCGATLPAVGAGKSYVWADWGTNNCVAPGNTVIIQFKSGGSPVTVNSVEWNLVDGTGSVHVAPVGGVVELPVDSSGAPASAAEHSGSSSPPYAAIAGVVAAGTPALTAGAWYARRRLLR